MVVVGVGFVVVGFGCDIVGDVGDVGWCIGGKVVYFWLLYVV